MAGSRDLLPDATYEQKLATGFNRNHAITQEGGVVQEEYLAEYAADRTQTFSTAFLGLTMQCARCHSHKYDPISHEDYYSLFGFFNNIPERGQINYLDLSPQPNIAMEDTLLDAEIAELKAWIEKREHDLEVLKREPLEDFEYWLKNDYQPDSITTQLQKGKIADFRLNDRTHGQFQSQIPNQPVGLMNINLPPKVPMPEYVDGRDGKALKFGGKNFLSLGEIGDFEWYDDFSFGGWIKHSGMHEKSAGIFARRNGEINRHGYDFALTKNNQLQARLIHQYQPDPQNKPPNYAIDVRTNTRLSANQWYHVFVTFDGSGKAAGFNIYINGQAQKLKVQVDSLRERSILTGNDFLIGNWNHRARELQDIYGFKGGTIDDVVIYNRALSPVEIRKLAGNNAPPTRSELYTYFLQQNSSKYKAIIHQLDSLRRIDLEKPHIMIMEEVDTVKATFVLDRGAYDAPTTPVNRGTPKSVLAFAKSYEPNRLGLTQWLFDEQNPLTSRVIVNRFWQLFFGKGLVNTPEDFGNQGALPSHPELLDWLAIHFRENGWDMKALVKMIVLSSTYRQDAAITNAALKKDKSNKWLARGPAQRLSAEMLRDQALVTSGLYYEKLGGKWVKPYQPPGIWKELANQIGENKYRPSFGKNLYRRSLYGYWKRTIPPPSMLTFDAAERAECTVKRQQTSTPLQSLILFNNPIYVEAARKLAEQLMEGDQSSESIIEESFLRINTRKPDEKELEVLQEIFETELARFEKDVDATKELLQTGASPYNQKLNLPEMAALTVVINTIYNLDEAKYR